MEEKKEATPPFCDLSEKDLAHLEELLGYEFNDKSLLKTSLRHRSWVSEVNNTLMSNERLEFLGDAVVGWAVTDIIYKKFSDLSEGKLTDIRKRSINADALSSVAIQLKLGEYIMLSAGEISTGGRTKISILCDVVEAVIGAIYLDGGRDICYELCERHMAAPIEAGVVGDEKNMDSKNRLQELIAKRCTNGSNAVITYVHEEKGPSHAPAFMCSCFVDGDLMGTATQKNKKTAEKHAAAAARAAVIVHLAEQGQDIHDANPGREKLKSRPAKTSPEITPPVVDDKYMEDLVGLQSRMGYIFNDPAHLITSLRHRSWVAEVNNTLPSNERFEFIGDAVLSWVVTMFLHEKFPTYSEGRLGDIRSRAINTLSIKEAIETHALNIGNHVLLGCGEINDGGKNKESIKTGVFLAMLGAIFTDGGIDAARSCVERLMVIRIMATSGSIYKGNSKNQLEDFVCRNYPKGTIITYIHTEVPPKHNATFRCDCVIRGNIVGSSNGKSKKSAEKAAAESTLEGLMRLLASGNLDTGFKYEEEKEGEGEVEAET